jgi:predicted AlkP superfamily phosphohydrolase/phosphomutase
LHKGLPYETEGEKQEHGHNVPSDEELINLMRETTDETKKLNKDTKEFMDSGGIQRVLENKKKRKQTSLELSILASLIKDVSDEI